MSLQTLDLLAIVFNKLGRSRLAGVAFILNSPVLNLNVLVSLYYICSLKLGLLFITGPLNLKHTEICMEGRIIRELSWGR